MLNHFPEIEEFFKQDYFTEEDLNDFKQDLQKAYLDKKVYRKALNLIELFLVKFKLSTPQELERFKKRGTRKIKTRQKKKKPIQVTSSKKDKRKKEPENKDNEVVKFLDKPISEICKDLELSLELVNRCLKSKNIEQIEGGNLNSEQFHALKELFLSKVMAKKRKDREQERIFGKRKITRKKQTFKTGGELYEALSKYGMKKLIYIRSK